MDEKVLIDQIACLKLETAFAECVVERQSKTIEKLTKAIKKKNRVITLLALVAGLHWAGGYMHYKENKELKKKLIKAEKEIKWQEAMS